MILWTIQPVCLWDELKKTGRFLMEKPSHLRDMEDDDFQWRMAYSWMMKKMRERIGPPPRGIKFPLWGWYQYHGKKKRKPDLRYLEYRGEYYRDQKYVRIEIEIPDNQVLLSDFMMWHMVLNYSYIAKNGKDDDAFDKKIKDFDIAFGNSKPYPEPFHSQIIDSWDFVLNIKDSKESKYWITGSYKIRPIQSTFWYFTINQVRDLTYFGGGKKT